MRLTLDFEVDFHEDVEARDLEEIRTKISIALMCHPKAKLLRRAGVSVGLFPITQSALVEIEKAAIRQMKDQLSAKRAENGVPK